MNIYGMMTAVCLYKDTNISARVLVLTVVPVRKGDGGSGN